MHVTDQEAHKRRTKNSLYLEVMLCQEHFSASQDCCPAKTVVFIIRFYDHLPDTNNKQRQEGPHPGYSASSRRCYPDRRQEAIHEALGCGAVLLVSLPGSCFVCLGLGESKLIFVLWSQ